MVKDTKRDCVWVALIELSQNPPTYQLTSGYGSDEIIGFSKADLRNAVGDDISNRTVHDVIQTAKQNGIIDMVKEPSHASIREHPDTGEASQMDIYATPWEFIGGKFGQLTEFSKRLGNFPTLEFFPKAI